MFANGFCNVICMLQWFKSLLALSCLRNVRFYSVFQFITDDALKPAKEPLRGLVDPLKSIT